MTPQDIANLVSVLRDAGVGIAAIVALIYFIRTAGGNEKRSDDNVKQLITLVGNNNTILERNNARGEKHTEAVREQTAEVRELKEKVSVLLPEMMGKQSLVDGSLSVLTKSVDDLVGQIKLMDAHLDTVKVATQNGPTEHQTALGEIKSLGVRMTVAFEDVMGVLRDIQAGKQPIVNAVILPTLSESETVEEVPV